MTRTATRFDADRALLADLLAGQIICGSVV
jgi:hypothetical protein